MVMLVVGGWGRWWGRGSARCVSGILVKHSFLPPLLGSVYDGLRFFKVGQGHFHLSLMLPILCLFQGMLLNLSASPAWLCIPCSGRDHSHVVGFHLFLKSLLFSWIGQECPVPRSALVSSLLALSETLLTARVVRTLLGKEKCWLFNSQYKDMGDTLNLLYACANCATWESLTHAMRRRHHKNLNFMEVCFFVNEKLLQVQLPALFLFLRFKSYSF